MQAVAKAIALWCTALVAAQAEPVWLADLDTAVRWQHTQKWLGDLSSETRTAELVAGLRALAEPHRALAYDRLLGLLTTFPDEAARLLPEVVAHERQEPAGGVWRQRRGPVLLPWLAASLPRTGVAEAETLVGFLQERLAGCRAEVPDERPWLQWLARARLQAIATSPRSAAAKVDRVVALFEPMAGPEAIFVGHEVAVDPSWRQVIERAIANDDPRVHGPGGPRFAADVRNHLLRGRPGDVASYALWPGNPCVARAWLIAAAAPEHPLARWGHVMALGSDDAVARARAATWLFAVPPAATDGDLVVLATHAVGAADAATQRLFLGWCADLPGRADLLTAFRLALRAWPEVTRGEAAARFQPSRSASRATWLERQLWPERVLAIGLDVGVEYVLSAVVRVAEYLRKDGAMAGSAHHEALVVRLYGPWRNLATRTGDDAAFGRWARDALENLPLAPEGVVPRLCRLLVDRDSGDRRRAEVLLQALRHWPDGEHAPPGSAPGGDARSLGGTVAIVDPAASWLVLAAIARDVPHAGSQPSALQPRDELAAPLRRAAELVGIVLVEANSVPGRAVPKVRSADWLDEIVGRRAVRGFDDLRDAAGEPLFAPVASRHFAVRDVQVVQFVWQVAAPAKGR